MSTKPETPAPAETPAETAPKETVHQQAKAVLKAISETAQGRTADEAIRLHAASIEQAYRMVGDSEHLAYLAARVGVRAKVPPALQQMKPEDFLKQFGK